MTYVCESLNRKKGEMSQQWGCEEVEDNCIQDKDTYHMRVFDNGENSENGNNSDNSENGNNGDNGFFFYAYGRTNKIYISSILRYSLAAVC